MIKYSYYCKYGTPGRIRTCDLRIRSPLLYPAELQAHIEKDDEDIKRDLDSAQPNEVIIH